MEVKGAAFLYALATLMITFAGFSALLLSIRQTLGAGLSVLDEFIVKTILVSFFYTDRRGAAAAALGLVGCLGSVALARRRAVFCSPDVSSSHDLFTPTPESCGGPHHRESDSPSL